MGKPVIGDVVVIPFRQTDLQVGKRRRALVVADLKGRRLNSMPDNFAVSPGQLPRRVNGR